MPVSSLIIRTEKDKTKTVASRLQSFQEATVSRIHDENIILITETGKQAEDKILWGKIEKIPGVLQCDLIYHNFEDEPADGRQRGFSPC
jgi:nitrate reductase NapAB chaperone NapD